MERRHNGGDHGVNTRAIIPTTKYGILMRLSLRVRLPREGYVK